MRTIGWLLGGLLFVGCGIEVAPLATPFRVVHSSVDSGGPLTPTSTVTVWLSAPPDDPEPSLALVRGTPEVALLSALEAPPLAARERAALVPVRVATHASELRITPRRPLDPNAEYTLLVGSGLRSGGARLAAPLVRTFRTADAGSGAPSVTLRAPKEGESAVPPNLRAVEFRVNEAIHGRDGFELVDETESRVPAHVESGDCAGCLRLVLDAELTPARRYTLRAAPSVRNDRGETLFGDPPTFLTAPIERRESATLDGLEVRGGDGCLVARFVSDEPTSAQLCVADRCRFDGPAGAHELPLSLLESGTVPYALSIWDESTLPPRVLNGVVETSSLALALTEVLARPLAATPGQQFVELYNRGGAPIDLGKLSLYSDAGKMVLAAGRLEPGRYALVVPRDFQPDDGVDPPVAAGTLLSRVAGGRLFDRGNRAPGTILWIEDDAGRVVTRFGGYPLALSPGQSARRARAYACDLAQSWGPTEGGRSTPGSG